MRWRKEDKRGYIDDEGGEGEKEGRNEGEDKGKEEKVGRNDEGEDKGKKMKMEGRKETKKEIITHTKSEDNERKKRGQQIRN